MKRKESNIAPSPARVRIGIHTSIAGRLELAAERAQELGCDAFQIFSSNPRIWDPSGINAVEAEAFRRRRYTLGLAPLVIHDNYLINLASARPVVRFRSIQAFRAELERALALEADYLVMHPGSAVGLKRRQALSNVATGLRQAARGLCLNGLPDSGLQILLENTSGQGSALGADLEELGELLQAVPELNLGVCLDTAHLFAAGYELRGPGSVDATLAAVHAAVGLDRVKVIHTNDSKVACGSRVDRHQHIGKGKIGLRAFRQLLRHPTLAGKTFILETPLERKGDDRRNLRTVRRLVGGNGRAVRRKAKRRG
ncbi:deoxyribonuclease IV [Acidobacteriia bacterium AH_259_A11_L15]|nr:deoxyribonuclease IV [Acidobacteriia bacterium AH_259_A11_L15]